MNTMMMMKYLIQIITIIKIITIQTKTTILQMIIITVIIIITIIITINDKINNKKTIHITKDNFNKNDLTFQMSFLFLKFMKEYFKLETIQTTT